MIVVFTNQVCGEPGAAQMDPRGTAEAIDGRAVPPRRRSSVLDHETHRGGKRMSLEEHERGIDINGLHRHPDDPDGSMICIHAQVQSFDHHRGFNTVDGCLAITLDEAREFANELLAGVEELS
jgi:hypothetical protein